MSTLNTVSGVEDNESKLPGVKEVKPSIIIKQRRASVTPSALPNVQLPRYLRDAGRNGNNRTRRQSLPARYYSHGPSSRASTQLPSIQLATDKDVLHENSEEIHNSSDVGTKYARTLIKNPVEECKSFPLDNRLVQAQDCNQYENESTPEIDNSSQKKVFGHTNSGIDYPKIIGNENENNLDFIGIRTKTPNFLNIDTRTPNFDKHRRHSIAVSDPNRLRGGSPLPGMTELDNIENSLYKSRDRVITVDDPESGRNDSKMNRYVPKPDNHILLSLFSCIFCCPIVGLVALIFSLQVDVEYEKGKKEDSIIKSKNARCWAISAVALGMMIILGAGMFGVIMLAQS